MTLMTISMVYIGNFTSFDTVEGTESVQNYVGEINPTSALIAAGPVTGASAQTLSVVQDDIYGGATTYEDDDANAGVYTVTPGTFTYNAGSGLTTQTFDYAFNMNATVVLANGTTQNMVVSLQQMQNGDVFIADPDLFNINIQSITFTSLFGDNYFGKPVEFQSSLVFVCFAGDTLIETDAGLRPVADLAVGDMVRTADDGFQPIRWLGSRKIDAIDLQANDRMRPIRIRAGALGEGLPASDLLVSRQHRMLVRSRIAARMFDATEILVPAHRLLGLEGVEVASDVDQVEYFHVLFDAHQVIFANGAPAESLYLGQEALRALSADARAEIVALFPEVAEPGFIASTARPVVARKHSVEAMLDRHGKHGVSILS